MDTEITIDRVAPATQAKAKAEDIKPKRTDKHIWGIYIMLCIISVVELYSASSHEVRAANVLAPVIRHVMFLLIGLACMLFLQRTHYKKFYNWTIGFTVLSITLMLVALIIGEKVNEATRSISFAGFTIQPAEMIKLSTAFIIAAVLCKEQMKGVADVTRRGVVIVSAVVLVSSALLFSEGLTNTLLLMCIAMSMMLVGGVSANKFIKVVCVFAIFGMLGGAFKYISGELSEKEKPKIVSTRVPGEDFDVEYRGVGDKVGAGRMNVWAKRLGRYFESEKYKEPITDENQQELYSYMAQAHGGVFGVMPGNSRETARLPLAFSDYIYAIIIEELGLVGGILVLVLYLWLLARAGRIAYRCQTAFPALLVIGMAVVIAFQAIFHMAIVTGVFPVSGQPLPLISKGGTSIIMTSVALGVMLSVSRFAARKGKRAEIKEELSELPDEVKAVNPT